MQEGEKRERGQRNQRIRAFWGRHISLACPQSRRLAQSFSSSAVCHQGQSKLNKRLITDELNAETCWGGLSTNSNQDWVARSATRCSAYASVSSVSMAVRMAWIVGPLARRFVAACAARLILLSASAT